MPTDFEDKTISPYAQSIIDSLLAEIATLRAEINELKKRLGLNSSNSSLPPSSDTLSKKKKTVAI